MVGIGEKTNDVSPQPIRSSERLRKPPSCYARAYLYYQASIAKQRTRKESAAARMRPRKARHMRAPPDSAAANLRRSTRKRKISINLEDYDTDSSSMEDDDLMAPRHRSPKNKVVNNVSYDGAQKRKISKSNSIPRREGLRPRRSSRGQRILPYQESEEDQDGEESSEEHGTPGETENGNDVEEDGGNDEEVDGGDEAEDGDDDDAEEEQDGKRRYDLRNRSEARRLTPEKEEKSRQRSPRRVLHHGMGAKNRYIKKGGSKMQKRPRFALPDESDDSLLVDEMDQGPSFPWGRSGRGSAPWFSGGLDLHGATSWGLNLAATGWGHQGENTSLVTGVQTAGPSSKGGADIQPLQVDGNVSFSDIGGLSEYIDALKEMVFFPLLYPDFFANYHITPPRGVLLCGPPGTGKTLIARALACAASKAGQKVSFYMRKGADVLSKWVGEAERQLKLLFEEAQKNQPSIIFFDEIDGLAPVRSSKQEQIHNSIVSTLLALMDGLDSRGQVVLIGATNRIDAIDGALRRPGRFDREFHFPLPGYEARTEILDIHTRKWKDPPSKELKEELAASCVGYCGADLKALCTEAAIRAFREKYPQVYTSDDRFVIDVNSVKVEKHHFLEAMSTITPAAHRGAVVHSRPLSLVVAPFLRRHLTRIMEQVSDIFPFLSDEVSKLSLLSYGSAIPLVYRPCLLLCGDENAGLDHIGPAVLHELEKFSIYSLGLPSLLSDPSAKTPEEALVHIFGEARRTTPSILYLPQLHLWWETAHEQLKAVLVTLLDELPSNLPILLLGTSFVSFTDLDEQCASIFGSRNVYLVDQLSVEDRSNFFDALLESFLSLQKDNTRSRSIEKEFLEELPKAPKEEVGPKASELRAKAEAEQHAMRRLRMCLRDICNRILYDKRFTAFHYPVADEDVPDYRTIVQNPIDVATILQNVDCGQYLTRTAFMKDIDLIVANAKAYNGDDYNGARIVSRACELRDVVQGMLSQMDPALVSFCDTIAKQGGPTNLVDDEDCSVFQTAPVVQQAAVTRTSARLRNVQPEVNISQSYEVLKRQKKSTDNEAHAKDSTRGDETSPMDVDLSKSSSSSGQSQQQNSDVHHKSPQNCPVASGDLPESPSMALAQDGASHHDNAGAVNADMLEQFESVKQRFMQHTEGYSVPELERLHRWLMKGMLEATGKFSGKEGSDCQRQQIFVRQVSKFIEDNANF